MTLVRSVGTSRSAPLALLGVWLAVVVVASAGGLFTPSSSRPPLAFGVAVVLPPVAFGLAVWMSPAVRAWVAGLDLSLLIRIQVQRNVGLVFLVLYAAGTLPALFALPAGLGDVTVGVTAFFIAHALATGRRAAVPLFLGWTAFGMLDLVVAIGLGVLHAPGPLGLLGHGATTSAILTHLPLSVIPTFLVPLSMVLHIAALVRFRARAHHTKNAAAR